MHFPPTFNFEIYYFFPPKITLTLSVPLTPTLLPLCALATWLPSYRNPRLNPLPPKPYQRALIATLPPSSCSLSLCLALFSLSLSLSLSLSRALPLLLLSPTRPPHHCQHRPATQHRPRPLAPPPIPPCCMVSTDTWMLNPTPIHQAWNFIILGCTLDAPHTSSLKFYHIFLWIFATPWAKNDFSF